MNQKLVTILIPCYNEEASLPHLYTALDKVSNDNPQYDFELLFVNDGSKDNTIDLIKSYALHDSRIAYVDLSRNFGKENAMLAGFDHARGDCMIILDADLQDPPELIPEMLHWWEEGYEDIYAKRRDRGSESWLRRRLSLAFYAILQHTTRYDILPNVGDFRLLDRKCIDALKQLRESERYTKGMFAWIGFHKKEILFDRQDREFGESHWSMTALFNLAIEGITSFTTTPLRISMIAGFVIGLWALAYMVWIITKTLIWGDPVAGYPTMMAVILFLGAVQLVSIGILGEYLGRIFNESKNRPTYLVEEYHSSAGNSEVEKAEM